MNKVELLSLLVLVLTSVGCQKHIQEQQSPLHRVVVVTPTELSNEDIHSYVGKVDNSNVVSLGFKVGGEIKNLPVKVGDSVHEGQLLAQLNDKDYMIGRDAAKAVYEQVEGEVERVRQLYARHAVSQNDYEKAEAGLLRAKAGYEGEQKKVDYTHLYAPTDGTILEVYAHAGEMMNAGMPVFKMVEDRPLQVLLDIPQNEYQRHTKWQRVICNIQNQTCEMQVLSIAPKADNNQMYQVRLCFEQDMRKLVNTGQSVRVTFCRKNELYSTEDKDACVYTVPVSSIFEKNDKNYVWVLDTDSVLHAQQVQVGNMVKEQVIVRGLLGNEQIVKAGVHHLQEGEKVIQL